MTLPATFDIRQSPSLGRGWNQQNDSYQAGTAKRNLRNNQDVIGRAVDWLDNRNQQRIDALPAEWGDENARSSPELEDLKKRLKETETEQQALLASIKENTVATAGAVRELRRELDAATRDLMGLKNTPRPGIGAY